MTPEQHARIKIDDLLIKAGWRFDNNQQGNKNIEIEYPSLVAHKKRGFADYVLLNTDNLPFVVLEAKRTKKHPLTAKEQARNYAQALNAPFIILSNGNKHYLWHINHDNPRLIKEFPSYEQLLLQANAVNNSIAEPPAFYTVTPITNPQALAALTVEHDYIVLSQYPDYKTHPNYNNSKAKNSFIKDYGLRFLRDYQLNAIHALQQAATQNKTRYLFEMATGTGKTLTAAAIIKLFLKSGCAKRVLFLVDRIELEAQALRDFSSYFKQAFNYAIYKKNRKSWDKYEIIISTVQTLANHYQTQFKPDAFQLVISDEAHRCISGEYRAVFEYFNGFKLGLTATPKQYLKNIDETKLSHEDPRALEIRQYLDTYRIFACALNEPTFQYDLLSGVNAGYLINPFVIKAQTDISTRLLSEQGYCLTINDEDDEPSEQVFNYKDFEKTFFSPNTNQQFCEFFLQHAQRDPISDEIGKTIIFCIRKEHARKITKLLNELVLAHYPNKYKGSDFAVQITSDISDAQIYSSQFSGNTLNGRTTFLEDYKSSKTRVCVTVGMMTTGYDCADLLNIVFMRPVFSATSFVQMKGRGTRKYSFQSPDKKITKEKENFYLFDFFAVCEFFETKFDYGAELPLPAVNNKTDNNDNEKRNNLRIVIDEPDIINNINEQQIDNQGMRVDRELYKKTSMIHEDKDIMALIAQDNWEQAITITRERYENKPNEYLTLEKLNNAATWLDVLKFIFNKVDKLRTKNDVIEEKTSAFIARYPTAIDKLDLIKQFLFCYLFDDEFKQIIDSNQIAQLSYKELGFDYAQLSELGQYRDLLINYSGVQT